MTPHPQPKTSSRLARATLFLAIGGVLFFLSMPGTAAPGGNAGGDAVVTVVFDADDMGFNATSSKDISNVWVVLCDGSEHQHDGLDGLVFIHREDQEITGVYVKSGNNGIVGNEPPGAGEFFANEGVDCAPPSTSTTTTDPEETPSETSTSTSPPDEHTICHATGSESNPYEVISPSVEGVFNGHLGDVDDHQDGEDIIPPFTYEGTEYSQNWDAAGQAIFDAGCEVESDTDTETSGSETDTETSGSETDSETSGSDTQTETEEIPVFGTATTLALGIGGALGGALLMLRRKL